jgi:L-alanine-DL-glutamate epimerase-like enolase superfamily enzyme
MDKLQRLAEYDLHSIEQPIRQGQIESMARLCSMTPLPIALDEELINVSDRVSRITVLREIKPQYIILKPSLIGGLAHAQEWIDIAESNQVGWWVTSALESNIGLNAIAQWTAKLDSDMFQGLGTGQIYVNNIGSPLRLDCDKMFYDSRLDWEDI